MNIQPYILNQSHSLKKQKKTLRIFSVRKVGGLLCARSNFQVKIPTGSGCVFFILRSRFVILRNVYTCCDNFETEKRARSDLNRIRIHRVMVVSVQVDDSH